MGEGVNHCTGCNGAIGDHAVGADAHAIAQGDGAFKYAVHVDLDIAAAAQRAAHIKPRRVGQPHALLHEGVGQPALVDPLQFGQLHGAVDACDLRGVCDLVCHHSHAIGYGKLHDIGQVILVLSIFIVKPGQPAAQQAGGNGHDAAVDLGDLALCWCGILVLDDGPHLG